MISTHGYGRYPRIDAAIISPDSHARCRDAILTKTPMIARGLGRSYGDSSLSEQIVSMRYLDHFLEFDKNTGLLTCSGGTTLSDTLNISVAYGWFLPVTPGTRFVTMGGAVAANVHGKNHLHQGHFCDHVLSMTLLLGNGECLNISRTQNADLFFATCGGMGLTGIILTVQIQLMPITSAEMLTSCVQATSLDSLLDCFEQYKKMPYLVAWVDALARGKNLGRGVLRLGAHAEDGSRSLMVPKSKTLHVTAPSWILNAYSLKLFNAFYYHREVRQKQRTPLLSFFYPLDSLLNWNKLYGRAGFLQYQCVLPEESARAGLKLLLAQIAKSRLGSFLAVLKRFGPSTSRYLSFPTAGYTLALDFKVQHEAFVLMNTLDDIVRDHGGRVYLAKDARMSEAMFKATYPEWSGFEDIRAKHHAVGVFSSLQSRRLGLM